MARFLLFALPSLLLTIALFNLGLELFGLAPDLGPLVGWHPAALGLPGAFVLGTWALEALALTALFLLIDARGGWAWVNGLAAAWTAWVFRGPLLVMTAAGAGGPHDAWWALAVRWFVLYTVAGLVLALAARFGGLRAPAREPDRAAGGSREPDRAAGGPREPDTVAGPHSDPSHQSG